jgi:hypothetical protein
MKRFILLTVFILQNLSGFAQSSGLDIFVEMYNRAILWQEKLVIMRDVAASDADSAAADFYARSFYDLTMLYTGIKSGSTEWFSANQLGSLLIERLVAAQRTASGDDFWRCYRVFTDASVQAQALIVLGELKIEAHFNDVVWVLTRLNAKTDLTTRANDEIIARGGFIALEKYGKPEGCPVVFAGIEGWYREYVKDTARSTLAALLQDPSSLLRDVILDAFTAPQLKLVALRYIDQSSLDNTSKADAASQTLVEAWYTHSSDQRVTTKQTELKRLALQMILKYGSNGEIATYKALERSLYEGTFDEKLECIPALCSLKTPEALDIIAGYMLALNTNRQRGITDSSNDRLMRTFVVTLGNSGDASAKELLLQVQAAPWSNTVLSLASDALKKLN